jgi:hypothetical protein
MTNSGEVTISPAYRLLIAPAREYIRLLPTPAQQQYADAYLQFLLGSSEEPVPHDYDPALAAQAASIRLHLRELARNFEMEKSRCDT